MALLNEQQIKKNIATWNISSARAPQNMVQFGQQANLTNNNQINQLQLAEWYRKAKSEWLVSDLPSYVKELRTYGVTVEWWDQAVKTKAKNDLEQEKEQKMLNAPRYKNLLMGVKDSMLSIPSSIQQLWLSGVSNLSEEIASWLGREDIAQRFNEAQTKTQQQMEDFWDIWQNKESLWYKWWKVAWDIWQSAAVWAWIWWLLKWTKAMQVINNVANVWQIYKNVTLWKVWLWALWSMWEQIIYSWIADKRLPTLWEMKFAWWFGGVVPLLPIIPAWYRALKWPARTADDLVLQITQATDKREVRNLMDALSEFDLSKVDNVTFENLAVNANDKISVLGKAADNIASKSSALLDDLSVVTTKEWDDLLLNIWEVPKWAIVRNYVKEGIELLKGHYDEIWDNQMVLELQALASKKVMTWKDINRLAKIIPSDKALNPFKTSWMPKTWVLAQRVENLRKWLKTTLRQLDPQNTEVLTQLDSRMSKLIGLRDQMQQNMVWLQKLKNKIVPRTVWEKVGRVLSNILNTLTMWTWQGFVTWSLKGNVGNKVLNYIDVEKQMAKNLKLLSKMDDFIELWAKQNVDELIETMAKETWYSIDDIKIMAEDIASVDELAKTADNITPQATQQLDNVASPTASLDELLKNATDEELKANWFTATMIKQWRKKNPLTKASTAESATQSIAWKADEVLQTPSAVSKVDDALPTAWKMWKTAPTAKSLDKIDDALMAEARQLWFNDIENMSKQIETQVKRNNEYIDEIARERMKILKKFKKEWKIDDIIWDIPVKMRWKTQYMWLDDVMEEADKKAEEIVKSSGDYERYYKPYVEDTMKWSEAKYIYNKYTQKLIEANKAK